jgi:hypothetical protein
MAASKEEANTSIPSNGLVKKLELDFIDVVILKAPTPV